MAFTFKSTAQPQTDPARREPDPDAASEEARQRARQQQQVREWKRNLYGRLMKVVDLSLIDSLSEPEARAQIREISIDAGAGGAFEPLGTRRPDQGN